MRPLPKVITAISNVLTDGQYSSLVLRLKSIAESSSFAAPEMQSFWWTETQNALQEELGNKEADEIFTVANIFAATEDYTLYL